MTGEHSRRTVLATAATGLRATAGCLGPLEGFTGSDGETGELDGVWGGFAADARNTGAADTTGPSDPTVAWEFETVGTIYDGAAVAGDTVFVGSTDGTLYAVDVNDGTERWRFPVRGQVRTTPAVTGDLVFVGGDGGGLYGIDRESGDQMWESRPRAEFSLSHPNVADGTVYAGSTDGTLYAFDAATGDVEWEYGLGGRVASSPAVADGRVFVGWRGEHANPGEKSPGGLTAVTTGGDEEWEIRGDDGDGSPTVVDGTVYAGRGSDVCALAADTGDELWRFETEGSVSSPAVVDGTVYAGSHDTNLYAIDADSGDEAWRFETVNWMNFAPAVADGMVYVPSWDTRVYGVDAGTGEKRWEVSLETPFSDPAVADGTVYVATEETLVALRDE